MLAIIFILLTPVGMFWPIFDHGTLMLIADLHDNTLSCEFRHTSLTTLVNNTNKTDIAICLILR
jgi:hypothetical protein